MQSKFDLYSFIDRARIVLEKNIVRGSNFFYTCPSIGTYPHQFLWDSCFHAIVWARLVPVNAQNELLTLVKKQFPSGLLPHMCYWRPATGFIPHLVDKLVKDLWPERDRSRITQPPLLAQAVAATYQATHDEVFLARILPPMQRYYEWLHEERSEAISGDGLVSIVHPWESGMDLLPTWDSIHKIRRLFPLRTLKWMNRLITAYNKVSWDIRQIQDLNLFLVKDVAFNSVYILNLQVLADLCEILGESGSASIYRARAGVATKSLEEKCWNAADGFFHSLLSVGDVHLPEVTIAGLFPIILDISNDKLDRLVHEHLLNPREFWLPYPFPSVATSAASFNPKGSSMQLWRGPTWVCTAWFLVKGLQSHGYDVIAAEVTQKLATMIERAGFREQYNPYTGRAGGARDFGWSTLVVDLLSQISENSL